jgi:hypothetical protein
MSANRLGRITSATVVARDLDHAEVGYRDGLGLVATNRFTLTPADAAHLDLPGLQGARGAWFGSPGAAPWLRVVEAPQARDIEPMQRHGWLSLEVLVGHVDRLAAGLTEPHWRILGPPADLDVSPAIRACQVLGPGGELMYLTEVKAGVPPFELPRTDAPVAGLFIVVLATPDREAAARAWEALAAREAWRFDTRITVLNRALGRPLAQRYPVAVLQFRERCLIEIDEVAYDTPAPAPGDLTTGVHLVSIACASPPLGSVPSPSAAMPRPGVRWKSPTGERVELVPD